jgi:hypothetical protein
MPLELPRLAIAPEWKDQQRLWGHSFHPMCSYLASFPAGLAHAFIARYSRRGDVVFDPFSGRGTTPLGRRWTRSRNSWASATRAGRLSRSWPQPAIRRDSRSPCPG